MNIELINTGSELLLGRVLNTHQQWLCRRLADLGCPVARQVAVPDVARDIQWAVREALQHADVVIVTGGLGPTSDDLTREFIADLLGKKQHRDEAVLAHINNYFAARNRPMPASNEVQAMVPEGAEVLWNPHGTAPGLAVRIEAGEEGTEDGNEASRPSSIPSPPALRWLIMLPGPTRELRPMFDGAVVPLLQREFPLKVPYVCRTLRIAGLGESLVQERIRATLDALRARGLEVGYCCQVGQVDVRLAAHGAEARNIVDAARTVVQRALAPRVFGFDDETLEMIVLRELTERKQTLVVAESCTGGNIAHRLTNVPGASAVFLGGVVAYSNRLKEQLLGVRPEALAEHGAVSEPVARQMAEGARQKLGADFAIAVTGIAGPGGGTPEKPVGTVFIAVTGPQGTVVERRFNAYERESFKQLTAFQALDLLRAQIDSA